MLKLFIASTNNSSKFKHFVDFNQVMTPLKHFQYNDCYEKVKSVKDVKEERF